jgi:CRP-like cAMP-binding protein
MPQTQVLRDHAFTTGLNDSHIDHLAGLATRVAFEDDQLVLTDGERSRSFFLLLSGSVAVELRTSQYAVRIQALGPGDVFGWSSVLDDHDTLFQVRAREHTTALRLEGASLRARCQSDPALGSEVFERILHAVAESVKATEIRFAELCGLKMAQPSLAGAAGSASTCQ